MREQKYTVDGFLLNGGDTIWVRSSVEYDEPTKHIVGQILDNKLLYQDPEPDGYIGAKLTSVFHLKENAYWANPQDLSGVQVGDECQRVFRGESLMILRVTEVTDDLIICGPWTFDRATGAEIDEDLNWGPSTKTGSVLKKVVT
jgi:hypothetical protein